MGTKIKLNKNKTTFVRSLKDEEHPFNRVPAKLYTLDGYQLAIMTQILSNRDDWGLVKYEIARRLGFPRQKFNDAWTSLIEAGYIKVKRIQGGYDYTIYEELDFTSAAGGNCECSTSTTGGHCTGGILTTTKNNYYREGTTTDNSTCQVSQFEELLALYPSQGIRKDGTTYELKGKQKECEKTYNEYLKSKEMTHEETKTALKVELKDKDKNGQIIFQPAFLKWLEGRSFEVYRGRSFEPIKPGYGQSME